MTLFTSPNHQPFSPLRRRSDHFKALRDVAAEIVAERKAAVRAESQAQEIKKDIFPAHDILSLLIKANLASDVPERMRLSDDEILGRASSCRI